MNTRTTYLLVLVNSVGLTPESYENKVYVFRLWRGGDLSYGVWRMEGIVISEALQQDLNKKN